MIVLSESLLRFIEACLSIIHALDPFVKYAAMVTVAILGLFIVLMFTLSKPGNLKAATAGLKCARFMDTFWFVLAAATATILFMALSIERHAETYYFGTYAAGAFVISFIAKHIARGRRRKLLTRQLKAIKPISPKRVKMTA